MSGLPHYGTRVLIVPQTNELCMLQIIDPPSTPKLDLGHKAWLNPDEYIASRSTNSTPEAIGDHHLCPGITRLGTMIFGAVACNCHSHKKSENEVPQ
jgi:hypothetical protein